MAETLPEGRGPQPEPHLGRRGEQRCHAAFGRKAMLFQLRLKLPRRVGAAKAKGRAIPPRPKPRTVRHDKQRPPPRPQHAMRLIQHRRRIVRGFQPVHDHQAVHMPRCKRPQGFLAQHRHILHARRPRHHALRSRHQPDHPPRLGQIGAQQRHRKAEPSHRLPRRGGPQLFHLPPNSPLRHPPQLGPVVEIAQIKHIQMHCGPKPLWSFCRDHSNPKPQRHARSSRTAANADNSRGIAPIAARPPLRHPKPNPKGRPMTLELVTIPCRTDNYAYLLHDAASGDTALIDAPEAAPILTALQTRGWTPRQIAFQCPESRSAFTADSLRAGGCGRLFEGTPAQMWHSLSKLAALPPETLICSGHEYTASNLRFDTTIEPQNEALLSRIARVTTARAENRATVPSRLSGELATNPFLRANLPHIKALLGLPDAPDAAVFAEIRARKDKF